jgi:hypothetical protein
MDRRISPYRQDEHAGTSWYSVKEIGHELEIGCEVVVPDDDGVACGAHF